MKITEGKSALRILHAQMPSRAEGRETEVDQPAGGPAGPGAACAAALYVRLTSRLSTPCRARTDSRAPLRRPRAHRPPTRKTFFSLFLIRRKRISSRTRMQISSSRGLCYYFDGQSSSSGFRRCQAGEGSGLRIRCKVYSFFGGRRRGGGRRQTFGVGKFLFAVEVVKCWQTFGQDVLMNIWPIK